MADTGRTQADRKQESLTLCADPKTARGQGQRETWADSINVFKMIISVKMRTYTE